MQVLRRDFHMAGNVLADDLFGQFRLHQCKIQTDPGIDEKIFHAFRAGDPP